VSDLGLYDKFYGLRRSKNGELVDDWYFVLIEGDPHARAALLAYARSCEKENPVLAEDLRQEAGTKTSQSGTVDTSVPIKGNQE
jgi:hypothetical protein